MGVEVHYVWYMAEGDGLHTTIFPVCAAVTISVPVYYEPVPTVTIPVSGENASVDVTVRVSGGNATVTGANVEKVLEAAEVGTVTVDVSSLDEKVTGVVIPGETDIQNDPVSRFFPEYGVVFINIPLRLPS